MTFQYLYVTNTINDNNLVLQKANLQACSISTEELQHLYADGPPLKEHLREPNYYTDDPWGLPSILRCASLQQSGTKKSACSCLGLNITRMNQCYTIYEKHWCFCWKKYNGLWWSLFPHIGVLIYSSKWPLWLLMPLISFLNS